MTESTSASSFTQGFLLGQFSLAALLFVFIKYFIFSDVPPSPPKSRQRPRTTSTPYTHNPIALSTAFTPSNRHRPHGSPLRPTAPLTTSSVLAKTYYNVTNHQPESVDWFNVLIAQTIAQLRVDAAQDDAVVAALTSALNGPRKPDWLDDIAVTEISLGDEFPIFSNCRVIPVPVPTPSDQSDAAANSRPSSSRGGGTAGGIDGTRLQARMDVDLSDAVTLGISTKLVLNYPRPRVAVMPVALAVSVVRFSGTLSISFIPSAASASPALLSSAQINPEDPTPPTTLTFSFEPSYRLELATHSLLGSRARLQDVPKIGQLIEARLHAWFGERCVAPRFQQVVLPSLWPRAQNTRGGDVGENVRREEGLGLDEIDEGAAKDESQVNGAAMGNDMMDMPRVRSKGMEGSRKTVGVQHPSSSFQMPGGLPDG